jgi:ubiquinone/menaquinone biosynthesis C-methylase UbiE
MKDVYEKFAYDYDEFGPIEDYCEVEESFFESLFKKHEVKTVLDCACGTGQHLYMFSEMGLRVSGSDYSESMLDVAGKNMQRLGKSVPLCQCDFRYLEQKHSELFDVVVCLTSALPHLHSDEDLVTAFRSMKGRLNKNGLLVLTQGLTHLTLTLPAIQVIVNRNDFSRVFVIERDGQFQTIHAVDLFHSESRTESNKYEFVRRIILDDDYKRLLSEAGFQEISIFGGFDMSEYTEESRRLIVVAQGSSA